MMLNHTSILKCPVGGSDLSFVDEKHLKELRVQVEEGRLTHMDGSPVQMHLDSALSSTDGQFIYPVVDGILILLPGLAIVPAQCMHDIADQQLDPRAQRVMRFYDEVGWHLTNVGVFEDTDRFEDLRPVSKEYRHRCHLRVGKQIPRHGKYLLDVASGPVQYPEYLAYSEGYDYRVCIDISIAGLRAAQQKLGAKGIYIEGDITHLPLKDASVDAFVSLHTIYHVQEEDQAGAFKELERVLKNESTGVVVYTWGDHCLTMDLLTSRPFYASWKQVFKALLPPFLVDWLKKVLRPETPASTTTANKDPELYCYPHDYAWFQREIASRADWEIKVWRSVSVPFLRQYVHAKLLGGPLLFILFTIEDAFPHFFGRFGQYPMMVYRKAESNKDRH
jgi:ubiquinone/menaquinone biosynthesis C-methylase UbiE/uncharacterized protein YbaR (Trm112 family)